jgi:5-methylcytosine-specific restriction endonuclease McrA
MPRKSRYSRELLVPIVAASTTYVEIARQLGCKPYGGAVRHIQQRIEALGISTTHLKGSGWSKGLTANNHAGINRAARKISYSDAEVFTEGSTYPSSQLSARLRRLGWDYNCNNCGINKWLGKEITLHVDHSNGIHNDHRLENLRFLCPNCHQQTDTWGSKNLKAKKGPQHSKYCMDCGAEIKISSTRCVRCSNRRKATGKYKIDWPKIQQLKEMIRRSSYMAVGRQLGVSGTAVKLHVLKSTDKPNMNIS